MTWERMLTKYRFYWLFDNIVYIERVPFCVIAGLCSQCRENGFFSDCWIMLSALRSFFLLIFGLYSQRWKGVFVCLFCLCFSWLLHCILSAEKVAFSDCWRVFSPIGNTPIHYQALSDDSGTKHTFAVGADMQTLTSPSDCLLCLNRIAHTKFLSDTRHCPMMTPESVCPTTVPDTWSEAFRQHFQCWQDCLCRLLNNVIIIDKFAFADCWTVISTLTKSAFNDRWTGFWPLHDGQHNTDCGHGSQTGHHRCE